MHQIFRYFLSILLLCSISQCVHGQIINVISTSIKTANSTVDDDTNFVITTLSNETLILSCNFTSSNGQITFNEIYWRRGNDTSSPRIQSDVGISITTTDTSNSLSRTTTLRINANLTVRPTWLNNINPDNISTSFFLANLAGMYGCVFNTSNGVFPAVSTISMAPFVQKMETQEVTSSYDATLSCFVYGYPRPSRYQWFKQGGTFVKINGAISSTLTIPSTTQDNRTFYKCQAETDLGIANGTVYLRVKDRYAVLWPCIGIMVEIVILIVVTVIAAYQEHVKQHQIDKTLTKDS